MGLDDGKVATGGVVRPWVVEDGVVGAGVFRNVTSPTCGSGLATGVMRPWNGVVVSVAELGGVFFRLSVASAPLPESAATATGATGAGVLLRLPLSPPPCPACAFGNVCVVVVKSLVGVTVVSAAFCAFEIATRIVVTSTKIFISGTNVFEGNLAPAAWGAPFDNPLMSRGQRFHAVNQYADGTEPTTLMNKSPEMTLKMI